MRTRLFAQVLWVMLLCTVSTLAQQKPNAIGSIAFSKDGKTLAIASNDGTVKFLSSETGKLERALSTGLLLGSIAISPDGKTLAGVGRKSEKTETGSYNIYYLIKLWDYQTGTLKLERRAPATMRSPGSIAFSPDGNLLAVGGYSLKPGETEGIILLWNLQSGERLIEGHRGEVMSIAFSPDGKLIASGSGDMRTIAATDFLTRSSQSVPVGEAKIWDVSSGNLVHTLTVPSHPISAVVGGREITGRLLKPEPFVCSVAFSPDGKILASGIRNPDATIGKDAALIWDTKTGTLRQAIKGHKDGVMELVFSPDGSLLATRSWDKAIMIWQVQTGKLLQTLKGHKETIDSIAFSPDGKILASGSVDGSVMMWDVQTWKLLRSLK